MENKKRFVLLVIMIIALCMLFVGGLFTVFAYTKKPYTIVQNVLYSYTKNSRFSVQFILKPNQLYDTPMLSAEDNLPIYLNLVNSIIFDYRYRVDDLKASGILQIVVLLKHPDGWSKKYLESRTNFSDSALHRFELNMHDIVNYMENICGQVGAKLTVFNISVISYVMGEVYLDSNVHLDSFTHTVTLTVDLVKNRISVADPLVQTLSVEEKKDTYIAQTLFGLSIEDLRVTSVFLSFTGAMLAGVSIFTWFRISGKDPLREFESRYRDIIVSASKIPPLNEKNIVYLSKPEEIVKISRLLEKPIVKYVEQDNDSDRVLYTVFDKESAYIFVIPSNTQ